MHASDVPIRGQVLGKVFSTVGRCVAGQSTKERCVAPGLDRREYWKLLLNIVVHPFTYRTQPDAADFSTVNMTSPPQMALSQAARRYEEQFLTLDGLKTSIHNIIIDEQKVEWS